MRLTTRHTTRGAIALTVAVMSAVGVSACTDDAATVAATTTSTTTPATALRLNDLQYVGSHNSYHVAPEPRLLDKIKALAASIPDVTKGLGDPASLEYTHAPLETQLNRGIRTFEIDIYADPVGGTFAKPKGPGILGVDNPVMPTGMDQPGIKVFHIVDIDEITTCEPFKACLETLKTWSDAHPRHLPLMISLELENNGLPKPFDLTPVTPWGATELDGLDTELRDVLGPRLLTPDDVRGSAKDLSTAVTTTGWPTVDSTRGKLMFFLDSSGPSIDAYLRGHASLAGRVAFTSEGFDRADAALFIINDPIDPRIEQKVKQGYIVRTRADADLDIGATAEPGHRDAALRSGAQIVHSDFPAGEAAKDGYTAALPGPLQARCNPVTAPKDCKLAE